MGVERRTVPERCFCGKRYDNNILKAPFESKLLPAVLSFSRIYFRQITVTVTVLKFGRINLTAITVSVLASAVTPSFPLIPDYHLESHVN